MRACVRGCLVCRIASRLPPAWNRIYFLLPKSSQWKIKCEAGLLSYSCLADRLSQAEDASHLIFPWPRAKSEPSYQQVETTTAATLPSSAPLILDRTVSVPFSYSVAKAVALPSAAIYGLTRKCRGTSPHYNGSHQRYDSQVSPAIFLSLVSSCESSAYLSPPNPSHANQIQACGQKPCVIFCPLRAPRPIAHEALPQTGALPFGPKR